MARPGTTLRGEYWHECARSGFTFPESEMVEVTEGVWVAAKFLDPEDTEEEGE